MAFNYSYRRKSRLLTACKSVLHLTFPWNEPYHPRLSMVLDLHYSSFCYLNLSNSILVWESVFQGLALLSPLIKLLTYLFVFFFTTLREESLAHSQCSEYICCWMYQWRLEYECGFNFLCHPGASFGIYSAWFMSLKLWFPGLTPVLWILSDHC